MYEDEPGAGFYQTPLYAKFRPGVRAPLLPSVHREPWTAADSGLGLDAVYCGDDSTVGCGDAAALLPPQ